MIMGLDISTSCVGISILDLEGSLLDLRHVYLRVEEDEEKLDTFDKAVRMRAVFREIREEFSLSEVYIEENLQAFQPGKSSADTIVKLARFNGIVSYLCLSELELKPKFINVSTARKLSGIKVDKKSPVDTKDQVLTWARLKLPSFPWPQRVISRGKRKGQEVPEVWCYDMADAYVISRAGLVLWQLDRNNASDAQADTGNGQARGTV